MAVAICRLALEDGTIFTGRSFGASGTRTGEVVFNTAMTGYQEIFSDPSYCGQIVTMTFPQIGNYGVNSQDFESSKLHLSGVVVRELPRRPSNFRAQHDLSTFLSENGVVGLAGVDTRAITRRLRERGALNGVLSTESHSDFELVAMARAAQAMVGANLVPLVTPAGPCAWSRPLIEMPSSLDRGEAEAASPAAACHLVVLDCGTKHNILRHLVDGGARVTAAPGELSAAELRALAPDGLIIGNGPGDPAAVTGAISTIRELVGEVPMLGICLGHQLLALALGARTYKLPFGHHGANLPVLNRPANRVEITSQNHGFAVDPASLERVGGVLTHVNLNDGSLEGFIHPERRLAAVQFHPEASPGPHDASYVFRRFVRVVQRGGAVDEGLFSGGAS